MTDTVSVPDRLGIERGMVVQELGWDEDSAEAVQTSVAERTGSELLDEAADRTVDVVLLWWREGNGDLVDALVDAVGPLAENGVIWVLTPKSGRDGYVEPSDIAEAASIAGLPQTSSISVSADWAGSRLVAPKTAKVQR
ncbi:DUF3052 domain-containing protein [Streptomyces sp. NPDC058289]|uniref:DUF3052 domain-containing protein n=1 Tax=Streptomyces sp. NPDC058289 TaxID=3346425 RepID=UPI0036EEAA05